MEEASFTITLTTTVPSGVPYRAFTGDGGGGAPGAAFTISIQYHNSVLWIGFDSSMSLPGNAPRKE